MSHLTPYHLPPGFAASLNSFLWPKAGIFLHDSTGVTGPGWWPLELLGESGYRIHHSGSASLYCCQMPSSRLSGLSTIIISPFSAGGSSLFCMFQTTHEVEDTQVGAWAPG